MDGYLPDHLYAQEEHFERYPEPDSKPLAKLDIRDPYLDGLETFITELSSHVKGLQTEEARRLSKFGQRIDEVKTSAAESKADPADLEEDLEAVKKYYSASIRSIRKRRRFYRAYMYDAVDQRQKFLDSMIQQRVEQEIIRQKLKLLGAPHKEQPESGEKTLFDSLSGLVLLFQLVMMLVFRMVVVFPVSPNYVTGEVGGPYRADDFYSYLVHISLLVTFGYGFLLVFVKKYSFSAAAFNFAIVAIVGEFALLMNLLFYNVAFNGSSNWVSLEVSISDIIRALYAATAVAVSWAVVSGKINFFELFVLSLVETFFYALNYFVCIWKIGAVDPGGAMTIHVFGVYFGLAASFWLARPYDALSLRLYLTDRVSTYNSNYLTLIGSVFVFCLIPSFNAALAPDGSQYRVTVNTFVAMVGGAAIAFFFSRSFRRSLFHIVDVQYSILCAGIAMGSGHAASIRPGGALLVGVVAGWLGVVSFGFVRNWMEKRFPLNTYDTRGAHWMHGLPGIMGGIASVIALSISRGAVYGQTTTSIFPHNLPNQGGYQAACLAVSLIIGLGGGFVTGFVIWLSRRLVNRPVPPPYLDEFEFRVPSDYARVHLTGGIPEP